MAGTDRAWSVRFAGVLFVPSRSLELGSLETKRRAIVAIASPIIIAIIVRGREQ